MKKILGDEPPITCRPADLIEPELDKIRVQAAEYIEQEEDILTYAMFPQVAEKFFKWRRSQRHLVDDAVGKRRRRIPASLTRSRHDHSYHHTAVDAQSPGSFILMQGRTLHGIIQQHA